MITHKLKSIALLATVASLPVLVQADVPVVDRVGRPAVVSCGKTPAGTTVYATHMDKIIFHLTGALLAAAPADQPALNAVVRDSRLDIKVLDNPRTVADLKAKVLSFLRAAVTPANRENVTIDDVDYAVICPQIPTAAGG
jgi:hypothetical protein